MEIFRCNADPTTTQILKNSRSEGLSCFLWTVEIHKVPASLHGKHMMFFEDEAQHVGRNSASFS